MKRVAVLYRVSTKKQLKKRSDRDQIDQDLPLQRIECERFIASREKEGWVHSGIEYIEGGVSGFHMHTAKRKVLMQAYEDAKQGKFDILLVYKLDRFGRRSSESLQMALQFIRFCQIWVVDKGAEFRQASSVEELMNFIEFWSAKNASLETKRRVTDAMIQLHEEGCWTGGMPPYGYTSHRHKLEVNPSEARVVRDVFHKYVYEGMGYHKIASWLNQQDTKPRYATSWTHHHIMNMIRLPAYKGYLTYGKQQTVDGEFGSTKIRVKQDKWRIHEVKIEEMCIVDEELWNMAQDLRIRRQNKAHSDSITMPPKRTGSGHLLLSGLAYCSCGGLLGAKYAVSSWTTKDGKKRRQYIFYGCYRRIKGGKSACSATRHMIQATQLERVVVSNILEFLRSLVDQDIMQDVRAELEASRKDANKVLLNINKEIKQYATMRQNAERMLEQYFMGVEVPIEPERINQLLKTSELKMAELETERTRLEGAHDRGLRDEEVGLMKTLLTEFTSIYEHAAIGIQQALVRSLVDRIVLREHSIDIEMKFDLDVLFKALSPSASEISATMGHKVRIPDIPTIGAIVRQIVVPIDDNDVYSERANLIAEELKVHGQPMELSVLVSRLKEFPWLSNPTAQISRLMRYNSSITRVKRGMYTYQSQ